ncbi:MAG: aspartate-semialdehyde dehydrogenase [Bacteroidetes bacterium]|nr:aspartate-semialdehyde dehydrogenase [Bacteroidota bacterium]
MNIAVVGATGLVGKVVLKVLEARNFKLNELFPVATEKSVGKKIDFNGRKIKVISLEDALKKEIDIAIFSAGGNCAKEWAPKFAEKGTFVIDNSSAWRMDENIPLVVPEINSHTITPDTKIIANPNCSTIQLVMALAPLHYKYKVKRIIASTYQSVTGSGQKGTNQLLNERKSEVGEKAYPHQIDLNVIPHGGDFDKDGYTSEETKLIDETRKILNSPDIQITSTVVRIPVFGGHSISANVEFESSFELDEVRKLLGEFPGIIVQDNPEENLYPMPINAEGKDEVFVGRIRHDFSNPNSLNLWIVADNLRKGAATNAVQISEYLVERIIG